jgi:predicted DNA-binding protein
MSNTLTIRLPQELLLRLRRAAKRSGLPVGRIVRQSLDSSLSDREDKPWMKYAGTLTDGPPDLSSRKGFSRQ